MLKFYILVSKDVGRLWRHFAPHLSNLSREETEVVINTTNNADRRELIEFCKDFNLSYHVTDSNGTPARGKNSVLEIFSKSSHDYCVQIDGDDILTPHGVELYRRIASSATVPDVICLKDQISLCSDGYSWEANFEYRKFFYNDDESTDDYETLYDDFVNKLACTPEDAEKWVSYQKDFHALSRKYVEGSDSHSRVVFLSKKAAQHRFSEDFVIGEDTLFYYKLKHEHMQGNLVMVCNDEAPATYIYNQDNPGTVYVHSKGHRNFDWMREFNNEVRRLEKEGLLYEEDVPLLKIEYTDLPNMNDYGSAGPVIYSNGEQELKAPANATRSSIESLWSKYAISIEK